MPSNRRGPTPKKRSPPPDQSEATAPTGRYTAPQPKYRIRPKWHRIAGWLGVVLGVAIALANDGMLIAEDLRLLPFGHQELYLILAVVVGGASTWFLGAFDRGTTIFD